MRWMRNIWQFYYDGFRSMTLGRVLWAIILIKLFIIFVVLKLFFFPNYIKEHATEGEEDEFVFRELKASPPTPLRGEGRFEGEGENPEDFRLR